MEQSLTGGQLAHAIGIMLLLHHSCVCEGICSTATAPFVLWTILALAQPGVRFCIPV